MKTLWQDPLVFVCLATAHNVVGQPREHIEVDCECPNETWDVLFANCKRNDLKLNFDSAKVSMNYTNVKTMDVVFHATKLKSEAITYTDFCWIAAIFAAVFIAIIHMHVDTKVRNTAKGTNAHTLVLTASAWGILILSAAASLITKLPLLPNILNLLDGPIVLGVNIACLCGAIPMAKQYGLASEVKALVKQVRPW